MSNMNQFESGLAVVLAEAPKDTKATNPVPRAYFLDTKHASLTFYLTADWEKLCPIWDSTPPDIRN
jgi:hypothetical protein